MDIENIIREMKDEMVRTMIELISKKAISPESGGAGEMERAEFLQNILAQMGFEKIERFDTMDQSNTVRPNIVALYKGKNQSKTVWFLGHMDTVPEGDITLWNTDPFKGVYKDGKIYGRGSSDNGQAIISIIFAIKALRELNVVPIYNVGVLFVSDEELGSKYGIEYLATKMQFGSDDLFYVPDHGVPKGNEIEIAEKSILWFRLQVTGKQSHGSRPDRGLNANRIAMMLNLELDRIFHDKYKAENSLFTPPYSTFEPTKRDQNVGNVNTIPGTDSSYFDCRILPQYKVDEVLDIIKQSIKKYEENYGATVKLNILQRSDAPEPTSESSEVVHKLKSILKTRYKINAKSIGIGGGTCAAIFRKMGYPAVVWSTLEEVEHQPNEYCKLENLIKDSAVFAYLMI